jgi:hypothetical protein
MLEVHVIVKAKMGIFGDIGPIPVDVKAAITFYMQWGLLSLYVRVRISRKLISREKFSPFISSPA